MAEHQVTSAVTTGNPELSKKYTWDVEAVQLFITDAREGVDFLDDAMVSLCADGPPDPQVLRGLWQFLTAASGSLDHAATALNDLILAPHRKNVG